MIKELNNVDTHEKDMLHDANEFSDDVTGQSLDKKMAREARELEMQLFNEGLRQGAQVDGRTRWLQGDYEEVAGHQPGRPSESELQSEAGRPGDQDGFPIGPFCCNPAVGVSANDTIRPGEGHGASRFPSKPSSWGDEGKVARLNLSFYGTRGDTPNWAKLYATFLEECGFRAGLASPCNIDHSSRELKLTVHGDDFTLTGLTADLQWIQRRMKKHSAQSRRTALDQSQA